MSGYADADVNEITSIRMWYGSAKRNSVAYSSAWPMPHIPFLHGLQLLLDLGWGLHLTKCDLAYKRRSADDLYAVTTTLYKF